MKKTILIDARKGSDFTMDALWAGLVDRLGWQDVIDWPAAEKHREGIPTITGDTERDYGAERRSLCYTPQHDKFREYSAAALNVMIRSGDIERIFVDERVESFEWYMRIGARFSDVPVVVVAGHDRFWNSSLQSLKVQYGKNLEAIFVDNWRPEYDREPLAVPMSYSTNFDHLWDHTKRDQLLKEKVYNICFMGYNSHGDRGEIVDHLIRKYGEKDNCLFVERRPGTVESFLPKREYFKKMAQSKICINLKGAAECGKALRFYEIPYVGSFMLSQKFDGKQVMPFSDPIHCMYFDGLDELDQKIEWALKNENHREGIARRGHEWAMMFHTARTRVDWMYDALRSM